MPIAAVSGLQQAKWSTRNTGKRDEQEIRDKLESIIATKGHDEKATKTDATAKQVDEEKKDVMSAAKQKALEVAESLKAAGAKETLLHATSELRSSVQHALQNSTDLANSLGQIASHAAEKLPTMAKIGIADKLNDAAAGLRDSVGQVASKAASAMHLASATQQTTASSVAAKPARRANTNRAPSTKEQRQAVSTGVQQKTTQGIAGKIQALRGSFKGMQSLQQLRDGACDALSAKRSASGECMGMKALPAAVFSILAVATMKIIGNLSMDVDLSGVTRAVRKPLQRASRPSWYDFSNTIDAFKARFQSNESWFMNLRRPAFAVSMATHTLMWNVLFSGSLALAGFRVLSKISGNRARRMQALAALFTTLAVGAFWGTFIVGFRSTAVATAFSVFYLALLSATAGICFRFDKLAGQILLPAVAWQAYVVCENAATAYLNFQ